MKTGRTASELPGIPKMPTGIEAFDQITRGGLPLGRTSLVIGGAGSGKTVLALQTLVNGARRWGEPGIFVAFEENAHQISANAASFGWDLPALEQDELFFIDARMAADAITAGRFDLAGLLAGLDAKVAEMGARRIVFDSMGVLLSLLDDPAIERREVYRVHDWLSDREVTGIITARVSRDDLSFSRHYDFMQFMADCVVMLAHGVQERVSLRTLRIQKYRGSGFFENEFPLVIGPSGIEVATPGEETAVYTKAAAASPERVSTGIGQLDQMLGGGLFRGSTTLISGAPGTAKSTLCGGFVEAACRNGEQALYISFDETPGEVVRNLASVNIHLLPHVESGLLNVYGFRSHVGSAEEHLVRLGAILADQQPRFLVIDPLSAMIRAGGTAIARETVLRLLGMTKARGMSVMVTSLVEGDEPEAESTSLQISTIADTWIHLSYVIHAGERNRALTVVKSRGTGHSNQVRELILSDDGINLSEVFTAGGEVLMGTLRWEKERADRAEREQRGAEIEHRRHELELAQIEAQARMEVVRRELEELQIESARLAAQQTVTEEKYAAGQAEMRKLRGVGDSASSPSTSKSEPELDQE
jgi:circadian clock protein KaiC